MRFQGWTWQTGISVFLMVFMMGLTPAPAAQSLSQTATTHSPADARLADEMETLLRENILQVWYPRILDLELGGYHTDFDANWAPSTSTTRMIVSQARGLWTACQAAARYPREPVYRFAADHGFRFLHDRMWEAHDKYYFEKQFNPEKGDWEVINSTQQSYGVAFGLYGAAAYARLTGSQEAENKAISIFYWLHNVTRDRKYGGYFDIIVDFGTTMEDHPQQKVAGWKDYNSSIHLLEALSEFYKLRPQDEKVKYALYEMLTIIRDRMVSEKGYLRLYFRPDWIPISNLGAPRDYILENIPYDHVTFGHDIETAYLLLEAAAALGQLDDPQTQAVAKKLVDHSLKNGFDHENGGLYEIGYYFDPDEPIEIIKDTKTWWAQAEALNTLLLFSKLYPQEKAYRAAFEKQWDYIKKYMIDHERGGWYAQGLDKEPEFKEKPKAHKWKSCYHNGRALMNCVDMLRGQSILEHAAVNLKQ